MKSMSVSGAVLLAGALLLFGGIVATPDPPASLAQDQRRPADYVLLDSPEQIARGVWCPPPDTVLIASTGRLRAVNYNRYGRGESDLLARSLVMIYDEYRLINAMVNLYAVAWEPGGEKLLVHETTLDDSAKWFILDVGGGQYDKLGPDRLRTSLGPRSYRFLSWTTPGEILFLNVFTDEEVRVPVR